MEEGVCKRKEFNKLIFDATAKTGDFAVGDTIFSRNYFGRYRLRAKVILRLSGPVSYNVKVRNSVDHRHTFLLRKRLANMDHPSKEEIDRNVQLSFDAADENVQDQADQPEPHIPFNLLTQKPIFPVYEEVLPASKPASQSVTNEPYLFSQSPLKPVFRLWEDPKPYLLHRKRFLLLQSGSGSGKRSRCVHKTICMHVYGSQTSIRSLVKEKKIIILIIKLFFSFYFI